MANYTIKKGDTLSKIAKQYGTTVSALASANSIKDANKIRAGATINIPDAAAPAAAPAQPVAATPAPAAAPAPAATPAATPAYTAPSEADLRAQAEAIFNPAYQQAVDALTAQQGTLTTRYNRATEDYGNYIDRLLKDTQGSIEDSLIKRGMGRSTRAAYEVTEGLADVNRGAQEYLAEIGQDYADNLAQLDTQRSTLAATKEQNIQSKILDLMQYQESIRQFNEDLAFRQKQLDLASQSSSGGGGGGSRTASKTPEQVYSSDIGGSNKNKMAAEMYTAYTTGKATGDEMQRQSAGRVYTGKGSDGNYYYKGKKTSSFESYQAAVNSQKVANQYRR